MDPVSLAALVVSLAAMALCGFGGVMLVIALVVGLAVLRDEGQPVTVRRAVRRGATRMSMIFVRREGGGLEPVDDEEDMD